MQEEEETKVAMLNEPEISKLGQDYGKRTAKHLSDSITSNDSYNGSFLYKNLQKNAESVTKLGERGFPVLTHSFDGTNHTFGNSPRFTEAFNQASQSSPTLGTLFRIRTRDEQGQPIPCLKLNNQSGGESTSGYLRDKAPTSGMEDLRVPTLSRETLEPCLEDHCRHCQECVNHQEELNKALKGITSRDPNTGDGMRSLHVKNLITTLNSWAAHQESQGNDIATYDNRDYDRDNYGHAKMATAMRSVADKLNDAYEKDYIETNGKGGGVHRDYFGVDHGRTTDVY